MEAQPLTGITTAKIASDPSIINEIISADGNIAVEYQHLLKVLRLPWLDDLLTKLKNAAGKQNFLVFNSNKYFNVPTENIAFFYIRYESAVIMCFDKQEYFVNYSLDQVQKLVHQRQFYRLNRQYIINFQAIREVEHYFARKLLVNPSIPARDKLIVPREKATDFLHWLDNR